MKGLPGTNSNFLIILTLQPDFVECRPLIFQTINCEIKNIKCKDKRENIYFQGSR